MEGLADKVASSTVNVGSHRTFTKFPDLNADDDLGEEIHFMETTKAETRESQIMVPGVVRTSTTKRQLDDIESIFSDKPRKKKKEKKQKEKKKKNAIDEIFG
ncbi:hypothetical protein METBIDRAFT_13816 [Metschnikowia bicuspidata var. bicuspidata NRRL YB-4993]|uniref:Uncharacterized protein n=1 Tax=Metschnikowia bicuspidata var. bicuspidata NRRL YB-4993 TaxID=869754 RepID=A0A1A0H4V3_9ASCO|nr:hypothetical protein METBIDRAFT_13816 [Metschnikowia bicuspidata var. bicuspidata NRRL YB-4993]OBA19066.1 hypothetical protein METBIDRAFT_13816 [Metschnikowia bicuspidata var. bicuspidata NRRL YB-4993]